LTSAGLTATVKQFANTLAKTGISAATPLAGQNWTTLTLGRLDELLKRAAQRLELLLVILPETITLLYNRIKHCGDVKYGLHTPSAPSAPLGTS